MTYSSPAYRVHRFGLRVGGADHGQLGRGNGQDRSAHEPATIMIDLFDHFIS